MTTFNTNPDPITSIKEYSIDENGKRVLIIEKKCNECQNESENENLYWDNELDKPNMVDYTCLCQSCYNKKTDKLKEKGING